MVPTSLVAVVAYRTCKLL